MSSSSSPMLRAKHELKRQISFSAFLFMKLGCTFALFQSSSSLLVFHSWASPLLNAINKKLKAGVFSGFCSIFLLLFVFSTKVSRNKLVGLNCFTHRLLYQCFTLHILLWLSKKRSEKVICLPLFLYIRLSSILLNLKWEVNNFISLGLSAQFEI